MFLAEQEVYIFYLAKIISIFNGERKNKMQYIGEKACYCKMENFGVADPGRV